MRTGERGFTLIELMIVVAIIAILAAIAIPAYQDFTIRAQISEGLTLASGAKYAVASFRVEAGRFPASNASAGWSAAASVSGQFVTQVEIVTDGVVEVTFGREANEAIQGDIVNLTPTYEGGSVSWDCNSTDVLPRYLPTQCR